MHKDSIQQRILLIVILMSFVGVIVLFNYLKSVSDYQQAIEDITFGEINVTGIADGNYIGECNVNFIYAKVEVAVHNGIIEKITILEHKNERGSSAETVVDRIVSEQKIDVDAVSGATNSSIVLKKAVENALTEVPMK